MLTISAHGALCGESYRVVQRRMLPLGVVPKTEQVPQLENAIQSESCSCAETRNSIENHDKLQKQRQNKINWNFYLRATAATDWCQWSRCASAWGHFLPTATFFFAWQWNWWTLPFAITTTINMPLMKTNSIRYRFLDGGPSVTVLTI